MSSNHERIVKVLAREVHDDKGWLSDAQAAQLEYNESSQSILFSGEGSIDLNHLATLVEAELAKERQLKIDGYLEAKRESAEPTEGIVI